MSATLHRHDLGLSWVSDDPLERACHALADAGRVWLIDPVDDAAALAAAAELGEPAAVVQLLDRHGRDCRRHNEHQSEYGDSRKLSNSAHHFKPNSKSGSAAPKCPSE